MIDWGLFIGAPFRWMENLMATRRHKPPSPEFEHVHHLIHQLTEQLNEKLDHLIRKVDHMSEATDKLTASVAAEKTVIASAVTAIRGFPAVVAEAVRKALEDAGTGSAETEAAVNAARADVEAGTADLQAALTENTPTP